MRLSSDRSRGIGLFLCSVVCACSGTDGVSVDRAETDQELVGAITRELWSNVAGTSVSQIPVSLAPNATSNLGSFEAPANAGDNYGQRVRGYLIPPATGSYTFWIAGDDNAELWLSTNSSSANRRRIAFHTSWTDSRQWNKFTTQRSAAVQLTAGVSYYIEALAKEGSGGDNLAVGWLRPGQSGSVPSEVIPGSVLATFTATPPTGGGGSGGAGGSGGGGSGGGSAGAPPTGTNCSFARGITWQGRQRFVYGVNYAWHYFGGDFGGIGPWGQRGVAANSAAVSSELAEMSANGVNVIRWWVWPDFRGDGIRFDASDTPTGLGTTTLADLNRALELAAQHDVYLMLTLFSFDNFRPKRTESGVTIRGIRPLVLDATRRSRLLETAVRPFVRAVTQSPNRARVMSWDVINEPEWAVSGASLYGDPAFTPDSSLETVTHSQMETFIREVVNVVRAENSAPISVGGAAMKWRRAWSQVGTHFHQFHTYDWVNQFWPYSTSPSGYGVADKPVVMGEFPTSGLSGASYSTLVNSWFANGYAGALSWQYRDFKGRLGDVKAFADRNPCTTQY